MAGKREKLNGKQEITKEIEWKNIEEVQEM